jgi:type II secretory ATPase GspE/PulE/Tfp pilus assembly ATPase PilB-like protein
MPPNQDFQSSPAQTKLLNKVYKVINEADDLGEIMYQLEQDLLELIQAERMTMYRVNGNELMSWYHTGMDLDDVIRVPIGPSSISGFVAMAGEPIRIDDVYNTDELQSIHPSLGFDYSYDQSSGYLTEAMVVIPIKSNDKLMGVIQLINRLGGGAFTDQDVIHAMAIAQLIGQKFRTQLRAGSGPFEQMINDGVISVDMLDTLELQASQEGIPVTILMRRQAKIKREVIGRSLEEYYNVPFLTYSPEFRPDQDLIDRFNPSYLAKNCWCPFRSPQGQQIIMLNTPDNADKVMEIEQLLNDYSLDIRVGLQEDILRYLGFVYEQDKDEEGLDDIVDKLDPKALQMDDGSDDEDLFDENASAIIKLVNHIIIEAVKINASDIHIEPSIGKADARVRMRVDGECHVKIRIPHTHIRAVVSRIKVLSNLDITEKRKPLDGKMAVRMEGKPIELRVATVPTVNGESAILRVLASGSTVLTMEELNFREPNFKGLEHMLEHPHGIILVVGPTGSGKTTTLHGVIHRINTDGRKILTAEDPVEITQPGLQQLQVQPKIGLTFASALRSFLRADPDVILIGEMRDFETASVGIEASLTGHLVFSTLHTNSAPETVIRLLDMDLDPMNFADALIGVLAQRLVRTLCKTCKEEYTPTADELEKLIHYYGKEAFPELGLDMSKIKLCRASGCDRCEDTGYRGRTGIHELLVATEDMKKLIAKASPANVIRDQAFKDGMRTLFQDGIYKILHGQTDLVQLRKVTVG